VLGVEARATHDELRGAFHAFAEAFHPDSHHGRSREERRAIDKIFKRGAEAFRVLSDPQLRAHYDQTLALVSDHGKARAAVAHTRTPSNAGLSLAPARLVDSVKSPGARPFVLRAEELKKKGDFKQAKIQLTLALHMERGNPRLVEFARSLDEGARKQAEQEKNNWKK
jgi:DnaJ-class molecular chaperone